MTPTPEPTDLLHEHLLTLLAGAPPGRRSRSPRATIALAAAILGDLERASRVEVWRRPAPDVWWRRRGRPMVRCVAPPPAHPMLLAAWQQLARHEPVTLDRALVLLRGSAAQLIGSTHIGRTERTSSVTRLMGAGGPGTPAAVSETGLAALLSAAGLLHDLVPDYPPKQARAIRDLHHLTAAVRRARCRLSAQDDATIMVATAAAAGG